MTAVLGNRIVGASGRGDARQRFSVVISVSAAGKGVGVARRVVALRATAPNILGNRISGSSGRGQSVQKATAPTSVVGASKGLGRSRTSNLVSMGGGLYVLPPITQGIGLGQGRASASVVHSVTAPGKGNGVARGLEAPVTQISPLRMLGQEVGVQSAWTPTNFPQHRVNLTEQTADVFAVDQGRPWESGRGDIIHLYGDGIGADWIGPYGAAQTAISTTIDASMVGVGANLLNFNGTQSFKVTSTLFWSTLQRFTVPTTGGDPAGYASFRFTGVDLVNNLFTGVTWENGSGTIAAGTLTSDDPRVAYLRHNLVAYQTDTDLSDGYTIDSFVETAPGSKIAKEILSLGSPASNNQSDFTRVFPDAGLPLADIRNIGDGTTLLTFVSPHGQPVGISTDPAKPIAMYLESLGTDVSTTLDISSTGTFNVVSGLPTNIDCFGGGNSFDGSSTPGNGGFFTIVTSTGKAIISYTSRVMSQFRGLTLVVGTGTVAASAVIAQGMSTFGDDSTTGDWYVTDVPSTTTIRLNTGAVIRAVGHINTGSARVPRNPHVLDPQNSPETELYASGGCSVKHLGADRQILMVQTYLWVSARTSWYGSAFVAYSDDYAATFTYDRTTIWSSGSDFKTPTPQVPIAPGDGYLYTLSGAPGGPRVARVPIGSENTLSAWRYWTGRDSNNVDTYSVSQAASVQMWTDDGPAEGPFTIYHPGLQLWVCCYFQSSPLTYNIKVRFSSSHLGPWSSPQQLLSPTDVVPDNGFFYGPFLHPWSGRFGNRADTLVFTVTGLNAYNSFAFAAIIGPWEAPACSAKGVGKAKADSIRIGQVTGAAKGIGQGTTYQNKVAQVTGSAIGQGIGHGTGASIGVVAGDAKGPGVATAPTAQRIALVTGKSVGLALAQTLVTQWKPILGNARAQGVSHAAQLTLVALIVSAKACGFGTAYMRLADSVPPTTHSTGTKVNMSGETGSRKVDF